MAPYSAPEEAGGWLILRNLHWLISAPEGSHPPGAIPSPHMAAERGSEREQSGQGSWSPDLKLARSLVLAEANEKALPGPESWDIGATSRWQVRQGTLHGENLGRGGGW